MRSWVLVWERGHCRPVPSPVPPCHQVPAACSEPCKHQKAREPGPSLLLLVCVAFPQGTAHPGPRVVGVCGCVCALNVHHPPREAAPGPCQEVSSEVAVPHARLPGHSLRGPRGGACSETAVLQVAEWQQLRVPRPGPCACSRRQPMAHAGDTAFPRSDGLSAHTGSRDPLEH